MRCPLCVMRQEVNDLEARHEADRIKLGLCWIDGGMLNLKPAPTTIRIDCPVSGEHRAELMALLKKIEFVNANKEQKQ